ncbi:MAG: FAD-dependent thymidylate synthase [Candidatus Altiarchaeota archaeon]
MKVKLLKVTSLPEDLIASAARICYASSPKSSSANKSLVKNLRDWGHLSTYEHASATFLVEDVSRACTHQLVRHRLASYSQQSQRYVEESGFKYITPPSIRKNKKAARLFMDQMESARESYRQLVGAGVPKEDARFVLPNATETKIVVTMNFRELRHFITIRSSKSSQWEIRELAEKMAALMKKKAPTAFGDL